MPNFQITDPSVTDETQKTDQIDEALIEAYLLEHPDFFQDKLELLTQITLPHGDHGAISLIERQQSALRERNVELRHQLSDLKRIAEANEKRLTLTTTLVEGLLNCHDRAQIKALLNEHLLQSDTNDFVAIHWFDNDAEQQQAQDKLGAIARSQKAFSGPLREVEMQFLFGSRAPAGSGCVIAFNYSETTSSGLLALGSKDSSAFDSHTGTVFISHIARVIGALTSNLGAR